MPIGISSQLVCSSLTRNSNGFRYVDCPRSIGESYVLVDGNNFTVIGRSYLLSEGRFIADRRIGRRYRRICAGDFNLWSALFDYLVFF